MGRRDHYDTGAHIASAFREGDAVRLRVFRGLGTYRRFHVRPPRRTPLPAYDGKFATVAEAARYIASIEDELRSLCAVTSRSPELTQELSEALAKVRGE
jgi:hypothetical protein